MLAHAAAQVAAELPDHLPLWICSSSSSKTFILQRYKIMRVSSNKNHYPSSIQMPLPEVIITKEENDLLVVKVELKKREMLNHDQENPLHMRHSAKDTPDKVKSHGDWFTR